MRSGKMESDEDTENKGKISTKIEECNYKGKMVESKENKKKTDIHLNDHYRNLQ